jgi:hypothetical protein
MRYVLALLTLLLATTGLHAQLREVTDQPPPLGRIRGQAGGWLEYAAPTGDFGQFVHDGFGITGWGGWVLDGKGRVTLGLEIGIVNYGDRTRTVPLSPTIPGLYADVSTTNNIVTLGTPILRVELTNGAVRPYVSGSVGFAYSYTQTSARGTSSYGDFASSTNFSDWTFNWSAGGGVAIQLSRGRHPLALDLGVRHRDNARVKYLNEDSITGTGTGTTITPIESEANLTVWQLGVVFGLR